MAGVRLGRGGALLLVAVGALGVSEALSGVARGTDVYLFLTGMILVSELARQEGLFDYIGSMPWVGSAGRTARRVRGRHGLPFVDKIGAGPFAGLTITASLPMSLAIDPFGWFGIEQHSLNVWRVLGGALVTGGIVLIAAF